MKTIIKQLRRIDNGMPAAYVWAGLALFNGLFARSWETAIDRIFFQGIALVVFVLIINTTRRFSHVRKG